MASHQYFTSTTLPINMSSKPMSAYYSPATAQNHTYRNTSVSPPEASDHSTTASSGVPSFGNSATSSSYAGSASASEYDSASSSGGSSIDLMELLSDRLTGSFDPLPLDRSLATQAQTSGALNAKHRELLSLQAEAQRRIAASRSNFSEGMKAAKEVKRDLDWTQKRVSALKSKAQKKHGVEYAIAKARYPSPIDC
ncbi:MAG: hypothetical protein M1838_003713 [Thelocarpon superellum]|nr:MAG: hypothetical protein M1838_003713 [Thelocarpon superellum]